MQLHKIHLFAFLTIVTATAGDLAATSDAAVLSSIAAVTVENPSAFDRMDEIVEIPLADMAISPDDPLVNDLVAMAGELAMPSQLFDADGDGVPDTFLVHLDFPAGQSVRIDIIRDAVRARARAFPKLTQAELSVKSGGYWEGGIYQGGEFVPVSGVSLPGQLVDHNFYFRYEGPGWESDQVGFRMYLDHRNAMDVFGKRIPAMVLQDVGLDGYESYHEDASWGLDILKVGEALGPGGFGQWDGVKALRVDNSDGTRLKILHNGRLRSSFRIDYTGWKTPGGRRDLSVNVSISAGSSVSTITLDKSETGFPLATGLPRHPVATVHHGETDIPGNSWTWLATYGKQSLDGANLGLVIFVQKKHLEEFTRDDVNELVVFDRGGESVTYHAGAVWEGRSEIADTESAFLEFVRGHAERLNRSLRVRTRSSAMNQALERFDPVEHPLVWIRQLADSILERRGDSLSHGSWDPETEEIASWRYTTGLLSMAMYRLGEATGQPEYSRFGESTISSFIGESGEIATYEMEDFNIDKINSGKMLLLLHEATGEERYRKAAMLLLEQMEKHPRTSGGAFWHKRIYPGQVWLDGVYMAAPFLARSGQMFGKEAYLDDVTNEFGIVHEHLLDEETGLYYHGWDELREQSWANPDTGLSETFWGRGMGWFAMALVDTLEYLPPQSAGSRKLENILQEFAKALERWQDQETGLWSQIVHQGDRPGNYSEASASSMFVYALARGVNDGYLDRHYAKVARNGFDGLVRHFLVLHPDQRLSLDQICEVAGLGYGRDGSYDYYMSEPVVKNDPKGLGPFLMAGLEIHKLNTGEIR